MKKNVKQLWIGLLLTAAVIIAGCHSYPSPYELHGQRGALKPGAPYMIQKGDTLFGIAWRYGLDIDELARWNNITNKNRILAGEALQTIPPIGVMRERIIVPEVTATGMSGWIWPTRGDLAQNFSSNAPGKQGIRISGQRGQKIVAAAPGEVAYTGTGLSGFGRMVIIQHPGRILSAYGFLDEILVREGQTIAAGQAIGTMGIAANSTPMLHFETRKQGKPVNPHIYIGTSPRY